MNTCVRPSKQERGSLPAGRGLAGTASGSFENMSRVLRDFFRGNSRYSLWPFSEVETYGSFTPQVEMTEDDKSILVTAELPGLDEKDIEISLTHDTLVLRGEKKEEIENNSGEIYCTERSYGSFTRILSIPRDVDPDRVEATFSKGVLHITLPKIEGGTAGRKIEIRSH